MADDNAGSADRTRKGGARMMQMIIVASLMLGEGVAVYFVANAMGPDPAITSGAETEPENEDIEAEPDYSEVALAECRPTHRKGGKKIVLFVKVSALVLEEDADKATDMTEDRQSRILDRIQFVIRSAEIQHINEPGLETIKRRLKWEMDKIFGDPELLREILIPEWQQSGSGV
ncbi:MAG: hypothetical protein ACYTHJ_08340 [Planctomycetota bacterium]|jgi:hypothetical protein